MIATASGPDPSQPPYEFRYKAVPLDSLIPSSTDALEPNPAYPQALQPRLRDRAASRLQIQRLARNLQPNALLDDSGVLDRGAPIVGDDKIVESGNGRILALRMARADFPDKFAEYQARLKERKDEFGLTAADFADKDMVLVRERITPVDRVKFAALANQSSVLAMSPAEQALQDSGRLRIESLASLQVGDDQNIDQALRATSNRPIVREFLTGLPPNEQAQILDSDGQLNQLGLQRVKAAIFIKVFPGEAGHRLSRTFFESLDPSVKNVELAMFDSLPQLAKAEALVRSGERDPGLSLGDDLAKSVDVAARLRASNTSIPNYLRQDSMFARELTPDQERILGFLGTSGKSRKASREFLRGYAEAVIAAPNPKQSGMFADTRPTKGELLESSLKTANDTTAIIEKRQAFFEEPTASPAR